MRAWNVPGVQALHALFPLGLYLPTSQATSVHCFDPLLHAHMLSGQRLQARAPFTLLYLPLAHFLVSSCGLLGSWNSPFGHSESALHAVLPVPNEKVPALHGRQVVAPVLGWYVPAGHGSHVDWVPWGVATLWRRVPTGQLLRWHALSELAPSCVRWWLTPSGSSCS